jgi:hypothetical protein
MLGNIERAASSGSEVQEGMDVVGWPSTANLSGQGHGSDGEARRRAIEGQRWGKTSGSSRNLTNGVQDDSALDFQGSEPRST